MNAPNNMRRAITNNMNNIMTDHQTYCAQCSTPDYYGAHNNHINIDVPFPGTLSTLNSPHSTTHSISSS